MKFLKFPPQRNVVCSIVDFSWDSYLKLLEFKFNIYFSFITSNARWLFWVVHLVRKDFPVEFLMEPFGYYSFNIIMKRDDLVVGR